MFTIMLIHFCSCIKNKPHQQTTVLAVCIYMVDYSLDDDAVDTPTLHYLPLYSVMRLAADSIACLQMKYYV